MSPISPFGLCRRRGEQASQHRGVEFRCATSASRRLAHNRVELRLCYGERSRVAAAFRRPCADIGTSDDPPNPVTRRERA
jgi:hypothetical protein